ncbi:MAG TPA: hypothetical protein PLO37_19925 [Candidatus Hydrogenedentes bacterium]|nr:hypothetical protein [Candidatus Hydrogenedentota bacterium]HPG69124.1 hypothetical protein [Candidatus Hydrogenedentota bacterium]
MAVSFRSIIIGLVLIPLNSMWVVVAEIMWYSGEPTTISLFYNVVFLIFLLILGNLVVQRFRPAWALKPPEILVVYTMLCISSALCGHDMLEILVPILSHLHRYAPIEGRYGEIIEHVPEWLVVRDQTALQSAYIGQESIFRAANVVPWLRPMAWWFMFTLALCAVLWGLNLVLRKQWTENEKLSYPVIQVPMAMATDIGALFRNKYFWLAFAIAGVIDLANGLNVLFPLWPKIPIVHVRDLQTFFPNRPWNAMGPAWVSFYPFAIGMCFFMPTDLAFSCWFFFFFWKLQRVLASYIGIHGMPGFPFVEEQNAGGYYAIALIALWITRHHLKRVFLILIGRSVERETAWDRREVRMALVLIATGGAFLLWFCHHAGMSTPIVIVFFALYFLLSIGITRMRAELGPPSHDLHHIGPQLQIMKTVGMTHMNQHHPVDTAMFGFFNFFNRAYRGHPMPHGLEGFRIAERLKMENGRYLIAMFVAIIAGIICGFGAMLWVFNKYGAAAQAIGPGEFFGREAWDEVNLWFTAPQVHRHNPVWAIGVGLLFCLGLSALRMNLTWWPFHPVGYAVSGSWSMEQLWLCIFIAWSIKALILKYGGAKAYKPVVPFFIGLILGDFMVGGFWNLYGIIMEVDVYHFWPY